MVNCDTFIYLYLEPDKIKKTMTRKIKLDNKKIDLIKLDIERL